MEMMKASDAIYMSQVLHYCNSMLMVSKLSSQEECQEEARRSEEPRYPTVTVTMTITTITITTIITIMTIMTIMTITTITT